MKRATKPKQWSSPYPKWVKSHSLGATHLLIAFVVIISLGLLYAYMRVLILGRYAGKFQNFPDIGLLYPVAKDIALGENPKAQLAMITIVGREYFKAYEVWDEELTYSTSFYFCSPDDEWTMQIDVAEDRKVFRKQGKVLIKRVVPGNLQSHFLPDCSVHAIDEVPQSFKPLVDFLRGYIPTKDLMVLEPVPRFIWMKSNQDVGVYWTAFFRYDDEDRAYGLMVDERGNELKKESELVDPLFSWQTNEFSVYP